MRRWWLGIALLLALGAFFYLRGAGPEVPDGSWLVVEVEGEYVESTVSPLLARLLGDAPRPLIGLLSELSKAERDDRLEGVIVRVRGLEIGWGKAQEIRDAIARLGAAGRRSVAHLEVEKFGANVEYYVASAADEVWVAPGARNPFLGLAAEYIHLGGLFAKLGIGFEYERVGKYKSAVETFAAEKMSEASREMATALLDSIDAQLVNGIGTARGLEPDAVRELIDSAPVTPAELEAAGLVDGVAFYDELVEHLGEPEVIEARDYARVDAASLGFDPVARVALVYGSGPVVTGRGGSSPGGGPILAAGSAVEAIENAIEADDIDALLLRVDSPGGSALASDLVWHALRRASEAGKPVVASFSDVAASGGYYVACGADRIVSQPATLTGSIGVFVLRPVLGELYAKLGIGVESFTRGPHAELLLSSQPLSARTRARLRSDVQSVYTLFVERVAAGRELAPDSVDAVGRGRVWTGEQAEQAGLVDVLGGYRTAVLELKALLGLDPEADLALVPWPPPRSLAEQFAELAGARAASGLGGVFARARGAAAIELLGALPSGTPVLVPPLLPEIR